MAQWILKSNGQVVPRQTVCLLTTCKLHSGKEKEKRSLFDTLIEKKWGTSSLSPVDTGALELNPYSDPDETPRSIPDYDDPVDATGQPLDQQPAYDHIINAELTMPHQDSMQSARVIGRSVGPDGQTTGTYHKNPILNLIVYDVEFPDGEVKEYAANIIAENLLSQVDSEGFLLENKKYQEYPLLS
jgi:hypothetical protein